MCVLVCPFNVTVRSFIYRRQLLNYSVYLFELFVLVWSLIFPSSSIQGVSGALAVLMKDAIKPTLMQTLEVRIICMFVWIKAAWKEVFFSKFVLLIFVVSSLPVFTAVSPHSLQFSWGVTESSHNLPNSPTKVMDQQIFEFEGFCVNEPQVEETQRLQNTGP